MSSSGIFLLFSIICGVVSVLVLPCMKLVIDGISFEALETCIVDANLRPSICLAVISALLNIMNGLNGHQVRVVFLVK